MQILVMTMRDDYYQNEYLPNLPVSHQAHRRSLSVGAGAEMVQKIYKDAITPGHNPDDIWDVANAEAIRIQFVPAVLWPVLSGERMPLPSISEAEFVDHGIFFKLGDKDAAAATGGAGSLSTVKPVQQGLGGSQVIELGSDYAPKKQPPTFKPWTFEQ